MALWGNALLPVRCNSHFFCNLWWIYSQSDFVPWLILSQMSAVSDVHFAIHPYFIGSGVALVSTLTCQSRIFVLRWLVGSSPCRLREVAVGPLIPCQSIFVAWLVFEECFLTNYEPRVASTDLLRAGGLFWCSCSSFSRPGSCCVSPAECCGHSGQPNRSHCHLLSAFSGSSSLALLRTRPSHWIEGSVD